MNKLILDFIERNLKKYKIKPKSVLDIGSLDVNGTPRGLFSPEEYLGIDIVDGKGVDDIVDVCDLPPGFPLDWDVVLCLNTLEHMREFWVCLGDIFPNCEYLFISVPGISFPEHHKPDYWRFTEQAVREVLMDGFEVLELEEISSKFRTGVNGEKIPINFTINCLGKKL